MKNFIKRTIDRIRRKPLLVKPVVSNSVICECCNDYGYIDVLFGKNGKYDSQMICPKCNGEPSKLCKHPVEAIVENAYGDKQCCKCRTWL